MSIIVTGAAGFIGSHLAEALVREGHQVTGVDCFDEYYSKQLKLRNIRGLNAEEGFRFVEQDLSGAIGPDILDGADAVFHLAARPGVRSSWGEDFAAYLKNNVLATQRLLEACALSKIGKFILASSSSIYGDSKKLPTSEDTAPKPVSPYGATKAAAEELCRIYHEEAGVPAVTLRYFTVYGPRQRPDMAFSRFIRAILDGQELDLYGGGVQMRDFTYIDDVVDATIKAAGATPGSVYNIGSGDPHGIRESISLIEEAIGKQAKVKHLKEAKGDVRRTSAAIDRGAKELGWRPTVSLKEGLRRQVEWQIDPGRRP